MKRYALIIMVSLLMLTSGCATNPNKIPAAYVSPLKYRDYDCEQLLTEQEHLERRTNELYNSLKKEAKADKWQAGLGLILFWPVLFALEGGDGVEATEYASIKGNYEALRIASLKKNCSLNLEKDLKDVVKKTDE